MLSIALGKSMRTGSPNRKPASTKKKQQQQVDAAIKAFKAICTKAIERYRKPGEQLIAGLHRDLENTEVEIHVSYAKALRRINKFFSTYKGTGAIQTKFGILASALSDLAQGKRSALLTLGSTKQGRPPISSAIWRLRAFAAVCVWLIERQEGSIAAAAAMMTKDRAELELLKSRDKDNLHNSLIEWRQKFERGDLNPPAAKLFQGEITKLNKNGELTKENAKQLGLKRLDSLVKIIKRERPSLWKSKVDKGPSSEAL
jgi:hypothetical protein